MERVAPVAVRTLGDGDGLLQHTVRVQVDHDLSRTGVVVVVRIDPFLLDGDVDHVGDKGVDHVVSDDLGRVAPDNVFFDGVLYLVAGDVELGKILKAPLPVVILRHDLAVDLGVALHEVDGDVLGADRLGITYPGLGAVDSRPCGDVGERDGSVLILVHRLFRGGKGDVGDSVGSVGGSDIADAVVGDGVACDKVAALLGDPVDRVLRQSGELRGLTVGEIEGDVCVTACESGEFEFLARYRVGISSERSEQLKGNVEPEGSRVSGLGAFKHLGDLESAHGRIELGVGDRRRDGCLGRLAGLAVVGDLKAVRKGLLHVVPQFQRIAAVSDGGQALDLDGLVLADHHGADAVGE